eukprot:GHVT01102046.1.p3 GENE.GHVT01102046.1~~GHVT01102046.1.p3  ORF type:complete len:112 (-),score=9.75 GHVT01102046.1:493-828(-)
MLESVEGLRAAAERRSPQRRRRGVCRWAYRGGSMRLAVEFAWLKEGLGRRLCFVCFALGRPLARHGEDADSAFLVLTGFGRGEEVGGVSLGLESGRGEVSIAAPLAVIHTH